MSRPINAVWFQSDRDGAVWSTSTNGLVHDATGLQNISQWKISHKGGAYIDDAFVAALPVNAELLRVLYAQFVARKVRKLWLTSPLSAKIPAGAYEFPVANPQVEARKILNRVEERTAASRGGARPVTQVDLDTFVIASDAHLAERHPAWPALSFMKRFDPAASAKLISLVMDPRWYISPIKPSCGHRLRDAFGLDDRRGMKTMRDFLAGRPPRNAFAQFAQVVLDTWYSAERLQQAQDDGSFDPFPWSIYFKAAETKGHEQALLKTCRVVLQIVREVWLDNLTPPRRYLMTAPAGGGKAAVPRSKLQPPNHKKYNPQLFVPKYRFTAKDVVEWEQHVSRWHSAHGTW